MITSIFTKAIADYFRIRQSLSLKDFWVWVEHVEKVSSRTISVFGGRGEYRHGTAVSMVCDKMVPKCTYVR